MRPHHGLKGLFLCALLLTQSLFSGCGYFALSRRTQFITPTENATVSIAEKEDGPYEVVTSKTQKIKLNHFKKGYFVKVEKDNHVSYSQEITRTSTNRLKKLDIALLITSNVVSSIFVPLHFIRGTNSNFGNGSVSTVQTVLMYANLSIGVAGWGAVIPVPGKLYPKKIELPALIPILTKDTNQLSLTTGKHEFKLNKTGARVRDYPTMKQFSNGHGYESRDSAETFEFIEELKLYDEISTILTDCEYGIDSTTATLDMALKLKSWTRSLVFMTADNKLRCELRTTWAVQTLDELQYQTDLCRGVGRIVQKISRTGYNSVNSQFPCSDSVARRRSAGTTNRKCLWRVCCRGCKGGYHSCYE
jgi:hypothetical protein